MAATTYYRTRARLFMEGWKECRRCRVMYHTERNHCKDCGATLAFTPKSAKGKRNMRKLQGMKRY